MNNTLPLEDSELLRPTSLIYNNSKEREDVASDKGFANNFSDDKIVEDKTLPAGNPLERLADEVDESEHATKENQPIMLLDEMMLDTDEI